MKWSELETEPCPVARALSVIGDRWTLLVLRDCMLGLRRFDQIQQNLGLTRHVLADRLKRLETVGVLAKHQYQERPVRYEYRLTESGKELAPILLAMIDWADRHVPSDSPPPYRFVTRDGLEEFEPVLVDRRTGRELGYDTVRTAPKV